MNLEAYVRKLARLRQVATHVDAHLDEPICLNELAQIAHLSRFHFERVFAEYTGETPLARVRRLRLERARRRIERGLDGSMLELAFDSGYGSAEAFSRAFSAHHGLAPSRVARRSATDSPIRIEKISGIAIQYLPHRGKLGRDIAPFERLRAHAMLAGVPRQRRKGWCVQISGDMNDADSEVDIQAALQSSLLGQQVDGLCAGTLPDGAYAVLRVEGGFRTPDARALARRVLAETGRQVRTDAPVLRRFENADYLPAEFERCFDLFLPVAPA